MLMQQDIQHTMKELEFECSSSSQGKYFQSIIKFSRDSPTSYFLEVLHADLIIPFSPSLSKDCFDLVVKDEQTR